MFSLIICCTVLFDSEPFNMTSLSALNVFSHHLHFLIADKKGENKNDILNNNGLLRQKLSNILTLIYLNMFSVLLKSTGTRKLHDTLKTKALIL